MSKKISFSLDLFLGDKKVEALLSPDGLQVRLDNVSISDLLTSFPGYSDCGLSLGGSSENVTLKIQEDTIHIAFSNASPADLSRPSIELNLAKQRLQENTLKAASLSVDCGQACDLSNLPILGSFVPIRTVLLSKIIAIYTSDSYSLSPSQSFLSLSDSALLDHPTALPKGATLAAALKINGQDAHFHTGSTSPSDPQPVTSFVFTEVTTDLSGSATPAATSPPSATDTAPVKWVSLQRSVGPIHINRIGGRWLGGSDGTIQGLLDAGLSTSAFSINFSGLAISIPLFKYNRISDYHVDLSGLDVSFASPTISVEGGLIHSANSNGDDTYGGSLAVKAASFSLIASAEFQEVDGNYSLFAFAKLQRNLGGPPAFKVTALSLGIGCNRSITAPSIDQVQSFPLLTLNDDNLQTAYQAIAAISPIDQGEYWIAAGIDFSSFEHIQSKVLAILEVGKEFEILILGQSHGTFPASAAQGSGPTYGYVELDLEVVLEPAKGIFKAEALLSSNSYVLDPDCHLTGGFAFYSWFGSHPNSGDFVFTVGGYNSQFTPPAHYPTVPRLGFNWNVSDHIQIKGGAYLAITPSCVMAGGSLEVLYQDGNLRAWLTAYADLLMYWKPFSFIVDIGISIGVSYAIHFWFINTTLRFELGATLNLYGPPTGGVVNIHLWVISFSISFGAPPAPPPHIVFDDFLQLVSKGASSSGNNTSGQRSDICSIAITSGLLQEVVDPNTMEKVWIVRAGAVSFDVTTAIPILRLQLNGNNTACDETLFAQPMQQQLTTSVFDITLSKMDGSNNQPQLSADDYRRNLPAALWGQTISPDKPTASANLTMVTVGKKNIKPTGQELSAQNSASMTGALNAETVFCPTPITRPNPTMPIDPSAGITAAKVPIYLSTDNQLNTSDENAILEQKTNSCLKQMLSQGKLVLQAPLGGGMTDG
jgi:hypothetical protein